MTKTKRPIDMLPLLDVFMVVLFVFATIQEQQLDSSAQELDDTSEALATAAAEREQQAAQIEALETELERVRDRSDQQSKREDQLSERVEAYEQVCGPQQPGGSVCPPAEVNPDARAQAAMASLHERLLDNVAVFEIEIGGEPDLQTGKIRNLCCYRADPPTGVWQDCGEMPSDADLQVRWMADGADGLARGLGRTRGGKAIVLLRQGNDASWRVSNDLAELLRERMPNARIYDDGATAGPFECPRLQG